MPSMTLNPPRNRAQESTQNRHIHPNLDVQTTVEESTRNHRIHPNLDILTTAETSTQSPSHHLTRSLAILATAEVTTMTRTGMTDATRPGPDPDHLQVAEVVAMRAMTTMGTHMVEMVTQLTETPKGTPWRASCPRSCPWWWSPSWERQSATSNSTGGGIASGLMNQHTSENPRALRL